MPRKPRPSRLDKALQERMYFISHIPPSATTPTHNVLVTGQTGNLYTVTLPTSSTQTARCNCVDQRIRKTLCKHMLFTLLRVLKLPREKLPTTDHNTIPLLSTTLLPEVLSALSRIHCADVEAPSQVHGVVQALAPGVLGVRTRVPRRVAGEGDECPICYEALADEALVHCEYGCGNGVHAECFERYKRAVKGPVRCVMCRTIWQRGEDSEIGKSGFLVGRRLVNVAEVVPQAFDGVRVRRLGLDKAGPEREKKVVEKVEKEEKGGKEGLGVKERIRKGAAERDARMKAREERRRVAERKVKGGMVTRSRRGTKY